MYFIFTVYLNFTPNLDLRINCYFPREWGVWLLRFHSMKIYVISIWMTMLIFFVLLFAEKLPRLGIGFLGFELLFFFSFQIFCIICCYIFFLIVGRRVRVKRRGRNTLLVNFEFLFKIFRVFLGFFWRNLVVNSQPR